MKLNCDKKSNLRNLISTEKWVNYLKKLLNMAARSENEHLLQTITQQHGSNSLDRPISNDEIICDASSEIVSSSIPS